MCALRSSCLSDSAFSDRVDLKQFIGHPNREARYEILRAQIGALLTPATQRTTKQSTAAAASSSSSSSSVATPLSNDLGLQLSSLPSYLQLNSLTAEQLQSTTAEIQVAKTILDIATQCEVREHIDTHIDTSARREDCFCIGVSLFSSSCFPLSAFIQNVGGRLLRRAPLRCYQLFLTSQRGRTGTFSLSQFLHQLPAAIKREQQEQIAVNQQR